MLWIIFLPQKIRLVKYPLLKCINVNGVLKCIILFGFKLTKLFNKEPFNYTMFTPSLISKLKVLMSVGLLLIVIQLVNFMTAYNLTQYGIHPRQISSVWTILTAPFIHSGFIHLMNNLVGLCIFSALYFVHTMDRYIKSLALITLISGALVWLFGRNASHIGASGVVFGLWSLCIATAWFERKFINIVIAAIVIIFYGGIIYGVLPRSSGVSFESHIFGVVAGIFCAYFHSSSKK